MAMARASYDRARGAVKHAHPRPQAPAVLSLALRDLRRSQGDPTWRPDLARRAGRPCSPERWG